MPDSRGVRASTVMLSLAAAGAAHEPASDLSGIGVDLLPLSQSRAAFALIVLAGE
jgi:hypothetical protein